MILNIYRKHVYNNTVLLFKLIIYQVCFITELNIYWQMEPHIKHLEVFTENVWAPLDSTMITGEQSVLVGWCI